MELVWQQFGCMMVVVLKLANKQRHVKWSPRIAHGTQIQRGLALSPLPNLKGCCLLLLAAQPSHKDWLSSGDSRRDDGKKYQSTNHSTVPAKQSAKLCSDWSMFCCHPRCPPRRAPPVEAELQQQRGTSSSSSLSSSAIAPTRLRLTAAAQARLPLLSSCTRPYCHRRSRLTIQMARPNGRELEGDQTTS